LILYAQAVNIDEKNGERHAPVRQAPADEDLADPLPPNIFIHAAVQDGGAGGGLKSGSKTL